MNVCDEWKKNPLKNPRTNRTIKKDGPVYTKLRKECEPTPSKPASKPAPKPAPTATPKPAPKPKTPKPTPKPAPKAKTPKAKSALKPRMSFLELKDIYMNLVTEYPINRRTILLKYHPDKLPLELKEQSNKYKNVKTFINFIFNELNKLTSLESASELESILNLQRKELESPVAAKPKPQLIKKLSFLEIMNIYMNIANKHRFPMSKSTIASLFHPDVLPAVLQKQMKEYKNIDTYVNTVYKAFNKTIMSFDLLRFKFILAINKSLLEEAANKPDNKPDDKPDKYYVFIVLGLGCKLSDAIQLEFDIYANYNKDVSIKKVYAKCNKELSNILKDIAKTACYMKPNTNTPFINNIVEEITPLLLSKQKVLLIGHSYGALVAGCVGEKLNTLLSKDLLKNLSIATFGSIYVSPNNKVSNINFKQYMMTNDIALKCNKLKSPKFDSLYFNDSNQNVTWIANDKAVAKRWDIHNSYQDYILKVLSTKNVILS
jgi:hypothetical protein